MPKTNVIAFVGTVGAGKSTGIIFLDKYFKFKGFKVKITQFKVGNLWAYPLYKLASMGLPIFRNNFLLKLWIILDIFAISLKFLISIWLPFKAGRIVLVEEYLPATIADYIHIARINGYKLKDVRGIIAYIYRLSASVPFTSIFLDANDVTLRKRWKLRGTPDEKPDYLIMQRKVLFSLTKLLSSHLVCINTSNSTLKEVSRFLRNV